MVLTQPLQYVSTRGKSPPVTFRDVLFSGYAPDGGLYLPACLPDVPWKSWQDLTYSELQKRLIACFVSEAELPKHVLSDLIDNVFVKSGKFPVDDPIPMKQLNNGINMLELFHGPTWAFKDLPLSVLGELLQYYLSIENQRLTLLITTSGDTGSAVIEAMRGKTNIDVVVMLPQGRVTKIQELQMTTVLDANVHVFAADGSSDNLDEVALDIFSDIQFVQRHHLASLNSINWGRILVQMGHWLFGYFRAMQGRISETLTVVVPTGAAGNLTAGLLVKKLGVPLKLVSCSNKNDAVFRLFTEGRMDPVPMTPSVAPAMDIQRPYNVERLYFLLANERTYSQCLCDYSELLSGTAQVPTDLANAAKEAIYVKRWDDADILRTMKRCYDENQYYVCPHTATALAYAYDTNVRPLMCMATAAVKKFPQACLMAGIPPVHSQDIDRLLNTPTRCEILQHSATWRADWAQVVRSKIESLRTV